MPQIYTSPQSFLKPDFNFAVVEASNDRYKPQFHVYSDLKLNGFSVFPINPREKSIQDDPCFPNLTQLRPFADVVVITIPFADDEEFGMTTLHEMEDLGIFRAWIEPDCGSREMVKFAELAKMEVLTGFSIRDEIAKMKSEQ